MKVKCNNNAYVINNIYCFGSATNNCWIYYFDKMDNVIYYELKIVKPTRALILHHNFLHEHFTIKKRLLEERKRKKKRVVRHI